MKFLTISILLIVSLNSSTQISGTKWEGIKSLIKKEDFEGVVTLMKQYGYSLAGLKNDYDHGTHYVLAEMEFRKTIYRLESTIILNEYENQDDEIKIRLSENGHYKTLLIDQHYSGMPSHPTPWLTNLIYWTYNQKWTFLRAGTERVFDQPIEFGNRSSDLWVHPFEQTQIRPDKISFKCDTLINISDNQFKNYILVNTNPENGVIMYYSQSIKSIGGLDRIYNIKDSLYKFFMQLIEFYPKQTGITSASKIIKIPLIRSGNIYYLSLSITGIKKKYVLDSGASETTIDADTYSKLLSQGLIKTEHLLSDGTFVLADGSQRRLKRSLIPNIGVSDIQVENVQASIVESGQPLLLGKSFLDKFKSWKIDNVNNQLILELY